MLQKSMRSLDFDNSTSDAVAEANVVEEVDERLLTGCSFTHACPYVTDVCRETPPELVKVRPQRFARCFHPLRTGSDGIRAPSGKTASEEAQDEQSG